VALFYQVRRKIGQKILFIIEKILQILEIFAFFSVFCLYITKTRIIFIKIIFSLSLNNQQVTHQNNIKLTKTISIKTNFPFWANPNTI
jgi:hypothetical protein